MKKICTKCLVEKDLGDFGIYSRSKDGHKPVCKACRKLDNTYYVENKEKMLSQQKIYYAQNKPYINARNNKHYENNKVEVLKRCRIYYQENKDKVAASNKRYRLKNKDKNNLRVRNRKLVDINYLLTERIRGRLSLAIKKQSGKKAYKSMELLGCSIEHARKHLESQFAMGMSWDNYGDWHIDHIRPCASFDLTDPEQQKQCFHYTNIQPLWAEDNLKKSDTY